MFNAIIKVLLWNVAHILRRTVHQDSNVAHHIHPSADIRNSEDVLHYS